MKTSTIVLLVLLGCGGLFLVMVVLCAGSAFYAYKQTDVNVSPKVDALFAKIDNGTFGETYLTETTPELRAIVSKEKWEQIGLTVKARLGRLKSKSMSRFNASQFNTTTTIDAVYDASFEKGAGTISVRYQSVNGQLLLNSFFVKSPVLDDVRVDAEVPALRRADSGFGEILCALRQAAEG